MKQKVLATLSSLAIAASANAASGLFESYGILQLNTTTANTYFDMQADTVNDDFDGADFGTFDVGAGNSLTLSGGEIKTWKNDGSDVTGGTFEYRLFQTGTTPGAFAQIGLNWAADISASDQKWDKVDADIDLLTGLSDGDYTLEVFASAASTDGIHYSNNGDNNYKANFSVIPEPAAATLGLFGALLLLRRRRS